MIEKQTVQITLTPAQKVPMKRGAALPVVAVLALVILCGAIARLAAYQTPQPGTILTVAGNGTAGFSGDGGPASQAALNNPLDQAVDASGNLFIADTYNNRVRKVSPDGTITTVVGTGQEGFSGDGGPAIQARLAEPLGLAIDAAGDLLVADARNNRIRKVSPDGRITTVAAHLRGPSQIAVGPMGNLFFAELVGRRIRKVDAAGTITTVAGGGHPADGLGDGGPATNALFSVPVGIAFDGAGNLYIADYGANRVRKVLPDGTIITVVGGGNPADGLGDGGPAMEARLNGPGYLTFDPAGNLFIPDGRSERVRKVDPAGIITTVAGSGQIGYSGDGGPATAARLNTPQSVSVDRAGDLFFVEGNLYNTASTAVEKLGNMVVRRVIGVAAPG